MKGGCYIAVGDETVETPAESAARARQSIATGFKVFGVGIGTIIAVGAGLLVWQHLDDKKHRSKR